MKTRILFVTKTPVYGGTEKHLVDLVRRLDGSNVDSTILCYVSDFYSRYFGDRPNVRVVSRERLNSNRLLSYWLTFTKLKPHTIVFINAWLGIFPWYAYLAARLSGAKRVFAIEHLTADPVPAAIAGRGVWNFLRRHVGWQARWLWRLRLPGILTDQTICVSNAVRERLISDYGYPESKTVTFYNGVDLKHYKRSNANNPHSLRTMLDLGSPEATIVCIANLDPRKGVHSLVEAMSRVVKSHPSCKCLLVGSGPLEGALRAQATRLGLEAIVRFVGRAEDVRPYLEVADLFVLSSENEGLPLVLGEAMAYGVPCIATDVGGNREIIAHGETGLIVKPGSPEQLAQAIDYLLVHREERSRMGSNAQRRVREHFNMDSTMGRLIKVLLGSTDHHGGPDVLVA